MGAGRRRRGLQVEVEVAHAQLGRDRVEQRPGRRPARAPVGARHAVQRQPLRELAAARPKGRTQLAEELADPRRQLRGGRRARRPRGGGARPGFASAARPPAPPPSRRRPAPRPAARRPARRGAARAARAGWPAPAASPASARPARRDRGAEDRWPDRAPPGARPDRALDRGAAPARRPPRRRAAPRRPRAAARRRPAADRRVHQDLAQANARLLAPGRRPAHAPPAAR